MVGGRSATANDANLLVSASHTFSPKAEASNHLAPIQTDQARGVWVDPTAGQVPFEKYASTWLPDAAEPEASTEPLTHLVTVRSEATAAVDDEVQRLAATGVGWGEIG